MELAINQACRLSKAGSNDFDRPKKKLLQLEGGSSGKRMSLSCLKNFAMLSLSYFVMFGSLRARMPMKNASRRDTRP